MAVITKTIAPGEQAAELGEVQKALISLGAKIDGGELATATTAGTNGPSTQAGIAALLARFGFGNLGFFNASVGRLLNIAVGAEAGSSVALRQAVRESFAVINSAPVAAPSELAWLARYATIARDFATARKILDVIPDTSPSVAEKKKIAAVVTLSTLQPPAPEVVNPENYYTVLYDYVPRNRIKQLVGGG